MIKLLKCYTKPFVLTILGPDCSENIDDCVPEDICNNGTCQDKLNDYACNCYKGFEGDNCETEIDECDRYKPCQFGSMCKDLIGDYDCECKTFNGNLYAGKNCSFELTACQNNMCQNGSTCKANLINETEGTQEYECLCADGFTGRYCNISTIMSFKHGSQVTADISSDGDVKVAFQFRTTLLDTVLYSWESRDSISKHFLTVELKDGHLMLGYHKNSSSLMSEVILSGIKVNDALWKSVMVDVSMPSLAITISLTGSACTKSSGCEISVIGHQSVSPNYVSYFGSMPTQNLLQTVSNVSFIGCMQDITINETRLHLGMDSAEQTFKDLQEGCPREEQCFPNSCSRNGDCIDLWDSYKCDCYRPHLGTICSESKSL